MGFFDSVSSGFRKIGDFVQNKAIPTIGKVGSFVSRVANNPLVTGGLELAGSVLPGKYGDIARAIGGGLKTAGAIGDSVSNFSNSVGNKDYQGAVGNARTGYEAFKNR